MTTNTALPQNAIPLEPMQDGKPPKYRIKDAAAAQALVTSLWNANKQRVLKDAAVQGMFDGNPPYNPSKMRSAGRAGEANFNTLEGAALLATACVPYYDLFAGDRRYVDISIKPGIGGDDERQRWSEGITEAFDRLLQSWNCFDDQMQMIITDFVGYGKGYAVFDDLKSWRFHKVAHHRVMVPDAAPIDLDRSEIIVVLHNYTVSELYKKLCDQDGNMDRKTASEAGWNVDETLLAIGNAFPVDPAVPMDAMAAQQQLRDNDLYVSARSSTVQAATIFTREFNGKWSEVMVRRDQLPASSPLSGSTPTASFLFVARNRYSDVREFINPIFFSLKDGSWNGVKGLGHDIFTLMQLLDRVACAQANAVFLRNSLVLQPKTSLDKNRMNLLQVGAITWIPEGCDVHQGTILGDISSTIEVDQTLRQRVERNTGIYRPTIEKGEGNPQTLGEFNAKFAQATALSVSAVNRFYGQIDRLYAQILSRVLNPDIRPNDGDWASAVMQFRADCERCGVPSELLKRDKKSVPSYLTIRAWRTIGNGSAASRQQQLTQIMGIYPLLPANGQQNLLSDVITVSTSPSQLNRYLPASDVAKLPTDQQAMAMLENAAMKTGAPVTWTPSQNNIIHADTHLSAAGQAAQSLSQGANPHDVLSFLESIGPHVAMHLQRESANPTSKPHVQALEQQWKQLAQFTDKLRSKAQQDAQQQQQLQQQGSQVMTDTQIKMMQLQGDQMLSRHKAMGLLQLKKERQDAELALKTRQQTLDAGLKIQGHQTDQALKDAETASEIHRKRYEAVQKAKISSDGE